MAEYVTRRRTINALHLTGHTTTTDVEAFVSGGTVTVPPSATAERKQVAGSARGLVPGFVIRTLTQPTIAAPLGRWLIRDTTGYLSLVPDPAFQAQYEPARTPADDGGHA